jgi:hypothetical protein
MNKCRYNSNIEQENSEKIFTEVCESFEDKFAINKMGNFPKKHLRIKKKGVLLRRNATRKQRYNVPIFRKNISLREE